MIAALERFFCLSLDLTFFIQIGSFSTDRIVFTYFARKIEEPPVPH